MPTPYRPDDITPKWLSACLQSSGTLHHGQVKTIRVRPLSTNRGVTGQLARLHLDYSVADIDAPRTLIVKCSSPDPQRRALLQSMGFYQREAYFYNHLAENCPVRTPRCYFSAYEPAQGSSLLLLEDLGSSGNTSRAAGCSPIEADRALRAISRLHATWWQHPHLTAQHPLQLRGLLTPEDGALAFQRTWPDFVRKLTPSVRDGAEELGTWLCAHVRQVLTYLFRGSPATLIHNDYDTANIFSTETDHTSPVAVIDWQLTTRGRPVVDVASILGTGLDPVERRHHEQHLLRSYHSTLTHDGLRDYTFVTDVVEALVRLSTVDERYLVVNVGSDRPVLTSQVIDELERALGTAATREMAPAQPGDVPATHADISRARSMLGWTPRVEFAEGIDRFCAWLLAERAAESGQPPAIEARPTPT